MTHTTYKRKEVVGWQEKMVDLAACDSHSSRSTGGASDAAEYAGEAKGGTLVQRQEATCYG